VCPLLIYQFLKIFRVIRYAVSSFATIIILLYCIELECDPDLSIFVTMKYIVGCCLKVWISESEQTPTARQRLRQLNSFTRQRVNNRSVPRKWKSKQWSFSGNEYAGGCCIEIEGIECFQKMFFTQSAKESLYGNCWRRFGQFKRASYRDRYTQSKGSSGVLSSEFSTEPRRQKWRFICQK
jgi:hypothetical protein